MATSRGSRTARASPRSMRARMVRWSRPASIPERRRSCCSVPTARLSRTLTGVSPDTQWAEPRWSRHGDRIAAARWTRGGYTQIVVLDTLGHVVHELQRDHASNSQPEWALDDAAIVYSSDRTGVAQLYAEPLTGAPGAIPIRAHQRDDGDLLARDLAGWQVDRRRAMGERRLPRGRRAARAHAPGADWRCATQRRTGGLGARRAGSVASTAKAHEYSPWRSLLPRYWLPLVGQNEFRRLHLRRVHERQRRRRSARVRARRCSSTSRARSTPRRRRIAISGSGSPCCRRMSSSTGTRISARGQRGRVRGRSLPAHARLRCRRRRSRARVCARTRSSMCSARTSMRDYTTDPAPLVYADRRARGSDAPLLDAHVIGGMVEHAAALRCRSRRRMACPLRSPGASNGTTNGGPVASKNVSAAVDCVQVDRRRRICATCDSGARGCGRRGRRRAQRVRSRRRERRGHRGAPRALAWRASHVRGARLSGWHRERHEHRRGLRGIPAALHARPARTRAVARVSSIARRSRSSAMREVRAAGSARRARSPTTGSRPPARSSASISPCRTMCRTFCASASRRPW